MNDCCCHQMPVPGQLCGYCYRHAQVTFAISREKGRAVSDVGNRLRAAAERLSASRSPLTGACTSGTLSFSTAAAPPQELTMILFEYAIIINPTADDAAKGTEPILVDDLIGAIFATSAEQAKTKALLENADDIDSAAVDRVEVIVRPFGGSCF
jgi:dienelactone hydrolase